MASVPWATSQRSILGLYREDLVRVGSLARFEIKGLLKDKRIGLASFPID